MFMTWALAGMSHAADIRTAWQVNSVDESGKQTLTPRIK